MMISTQPSTKPPEAIAKALAKRILVNEPLSKHTSLRIGGPAALLVIVEHLDELRQLVRSACSYFPWVILGGGANVLASDAGYPGLVILNRCRGYSLTVTGDTAILRAESGVLLPGLARRLVRDGWAGLEWAVGVPGTVGGAIIGNAGAHGQEIEGRLLRVTALSPQREEITYDREEASFAYRSSRFKESGEVVLEAELLLHRDDPETLGARIAEYQSSRVTTQPREPNSGSIFKNPLGQYAGALIERAGLKGHRIGDAQISSVHANFIVNLGQAKATDVLSLIDLARTRVEELFGIRLELEIQLIGFKARRGGD